MSPTVAILLAGDEQDHIDRKRLRFGTWAADELYGFYSGILYYSETKIAGR